MGPVSARTPTLPVSPRRDRATRRAVARSALKIGPLERLRCWLRWIETVAWRTANFRRPRMRRRRGLALSRRRTGRWTFSARSCTRRLEPIPSIRRFRISGAKISPLLCHQRRTVSWLMSTTRACRRPSPVAERQGKLHVEHRRQAGDLRACREPVASVALAHAGRPGDRPIRLWSRPSDRVASGPPGHMLRS
jgi:hypothetical protein